MVHDWSFGGGARLACSGHRNSHQITNSLCVHGQRRGFFSRAALARFPGTRARGRGRPAPSPRPRRPGYHLDELAGQIFGGFWMVAGIARLFRRFRVPSTLRLLPSTVRKYYSAYVTMQSPVGQVPCLRYCHEQRERSERFSSPIRTPCLAPGNLRISRPPSVSSEHRSNKKQTFACSNAATANVHMA